MSFFALSIDTFSTVLPSTILRASPEKERQGAYE